MIFSWRGKASLILSVGLFAIARHEDWFARTNPVLVDSKRRDLLFLTPEIDPYVGREHSLRHDGLRRWFMEYQPDNFQENSPLLLQMHWGSGNMRSSWGFGRILEKDPWLRNSKKDGFLVLSPNGTRKRKYFRGLDTRGLKQQWNDILGVGVAATGADDVGFIAALVDWAIRERKVDPKRVYIAGISSGGLMSFRMLAERAELFAAAASFGASLPQREVPLYSSPTPIFIMSGTEDKVFPWNGRDTSGANTRGPTRSAEGTLDYFVASNKAGPDVTEITLPDVDVNDGCRIVTQLFHSDAGPVLFYRMDGGGHLPSGPELERMEDRFFDEFAGPTCHDVIGLDEAWKFMSQFSQ